MRRVVIPGLVVGETLAPAAASHHLLHVLRLREGDGVGVTNGAGGLADATIACVRDGRAILRVERVTMAAPEPARVVLLGMPKPALVEEAVQLGTEVGATSFVLVRARYSPPGEPRLERLEKIVQAAVTQCGRGTVPRLAVVASVADAMVGLDAGSAREDGVTGIPIARYVGVYGASSPERVAGDFTVAIGPEGGWSAEELATLSAANFTGIGLGPHILRAPTAVAVALGLLSCS